MRCAVDAFPLNAALVGGGEAAVVQRAVEGAGETELHQDLRQDGRQPEATPPEHHGPLLQVFLIGGQSAAKVQADGLGAKQRQRGLGELAAHQRGRAVGQCLLQPVERFRLAAGQFGDDLAGSQEVARLPAGQIRPQPVAQGGRGQQGQVQQPSRDGVVILMGLVQPVEGRLQMLAGGRGVAAEGFAGRRHCGRLQRTFVQVAHVAELASQQFDLEVAIAQGEKIGRQIGIETRITQGDSPIFVERKLGQSPGW